MTWKNETGFNNVDDLFKYLLKMWKKDEPVACRGQADSRWVLQASLDRILDPNADYAARLAEENAILEKFRILVHEYVGLNEEKLLYCGKKIDALALLQHYHAPTRLLDWTLSPWVALYFAAIDHHDKDGAVWWFDQKTFEDEVHLRWKEYNMNQYREPVPEGEINLNKTAFNTDGPLWITKLHYPMPFHRIEVQQGFFTVAGRLGFEHGELIADVFDSSGVASPQDHYARVIVPALWKQEILDRLRNMNIHSRSLDYCGADMVGFGIRNEYRQLYDVNNKMSMGEMGGIMTKSGWL